jgi:DNA-binding CsgD family transcriptional regulator
MAKRTVTHLIGRIYEAAVDEAVWPMFLEELAETLSAASTVLYLESLQDPKGDVGVCVRTDPALIKEFDEHYSKVNIWTRKGRHLLTPGNVVTGEMVCSPGELRRSEYSEYLDKLRVAHGVGAVIRQDGLAVSVLTSLRSPQAGAFDTEQVALLQALMPHLQRAVEIHARLAHCRVVESGSLEPLERTSLGVIIVQADRRVVFQNRAAERITGSGDGLLIVDGELRTLSSSHTAALREFLANATALSAAPGAIAPPVHLVNRRSLKQPYVLTAAPFSVPSTRVPGLREDAVAVYVRDPEAPLSINGDVLRSLYGLTDAEVDVSTLLASGLSVERIGAALRITPGTTRWHLKRVFEKTGTRNQADLVRAVLTCATISA